MLIERPPFLTTPLAQGMLWQASADWIYEEKLDGRWATLEIDGCFLVGERMPDGRFIAFDMVFIKGVYVAAFPLWKRLAHLDRMFPGIPRPRRGPGAEFLEAILAEGGEGVVAKNLRLPFGAEWHKCKRIQTFDLRVVEKYPLGAAALVLADAATGEPRGKCACWRGLETIAVGSIVEIAAYGLTAQGKLREPRFLRCRPDKT
jgi:ATP-dependent DNA ligase